MSVVSSNSQVSNNPNGVPEDSPSTTDIAGGPVLPPVTPVGGSVPSTVAPGTPTMSTLLHTPAGPQWTDTEAMDFIMNFILQFPGDDHPVKLALKAEGIYPLEQFLMITPEHIDSLAQKWS